MKMSQTELAPVAIFAYNRPDKIAALFDSLRRCENFNESCIHVFVDGAKGDHDAPAVAEVQAFVRALDLPNVTWTFSNYNLGLRKSIYAGVTKLIRTHDQVIVLEDDLTLSPIALNYFNSALSRYAAAPRVWSIAGYIYDAAALRGSPQTIAMPFAHPWGWATWGRAWNKFQLDAQPPIDQLRAASFRSAFDMNGLYPFTLQLENSIRGRVNSWYIHWYYTIFSNGGVSVFPPQRVCDNHGLSDGSHGGSFNPHDRLVYRPPLLDNLPQFCDPDSIDYWALDELKNCRELRVQRLIARAGSARRSLKALR